MLKPIFNSEGTEVIAVEITVKENTYIIDMTLNVTDYSMDQNHELERTIL